MIITINTFIPLLLKGELMTILDKLAQQIENILKQQKLLLAENKKLKQKIEMLENAEPTITRLKEEKRKQNQKIRELTEKIEELLTL